MPKESIVRAAKKIQNQGGKGVAQWQKALLVLIPGFQWAPATKGSQRRLCLRPLAGAPPSSRTRQKHYTAKVRLARRPRQPHFPRSLDPVLPSDVRSWTRESVSNMCSLPQGSRRIGALHARLRHNQTQSVDERDNNNAEPLRSMTQAEGEQRATCMGFSRHPLSSAQALLAAIL